MSKALGRRQFLIQSSAVAVTAPAFSLTSRARSAALNPPAGNRLKKACCIGLLPSSMTVLERFQLAKRLGFEGIEPNTLNTPEEVAEYREASKSTGLKIHSIMNSDHWRYPLSDDDPEVVAKCVEGIKTSLQNAHELGADAVLLVPGIVTPRVRYAQVYERSQKEIRKLLPLAESLNVIIAIENVGNRFLLSPLEFARYVEEFESPWVRSYFDVGNVTSIGFPPDWIRTLGKSLVKVHIKKFEPGVDHPQFDPDDRRTQGIDWPEVHRALTEVGYSGWVSVEIRSGSEEYLRELSSRMDEILDGRSPV